MSVTLPKGWKGIDLNKVVIYGKGKKPKTLSNNNKKGMVPYINIKAFERGIIDEYADMSSSKIIVEDDILVVWDGARFGLTGIGMKGAAGSTLMVLTPVVNYPKYIYSFINRYYFYINSKPKGAATPHVDPDIFWKLQFPLAPLNEQKRIVVKLDKIIPHIDVVKERLDKVPIIIKRFRQSVLSAAVTGKLTEKWREENLNVDSADVLLKRIREKHIELYKQKKITKPKVSTPIDEKELKFEISDNWKWCRIAQISLKMSTGPFGSMLHKSDYIPNGIPVVNPTNILNERLIASNKMMISKNTLKRLSKYTLNENDIVIARRGDLGKCGIVTNNEDGWLCGTGSFFLKLGINPVFFRLFYISDFCQTVLNADAIGTTMANLNQKVLSNIPIPLPPLEEQKEIVRQVDKLFTIADKLETHYQNSKARIDKLPQSVLAKAFRGELVPQDTNDEPAEKLLERIQEEKKKMEAVLKKPRRKSAKTRKK